MMKLLMAAVCQECTITIDTYELSGFINERIVKGTWVQYLATKKEKTDMLKILLELGYI